MKKLLLIWCVLLANGSCFAAERTVLARVTCYWPMGASNARGCGTGAILRNGHCAVDPHHIPYRSKVVFPDATCEAVDSGPAVVSRKSALACGRTKAQREALVIDRFFESKAEAVRWSNSHPQFMTLRVIPPGESQQTAAVVAKQEIAAPVPIKVAQTEKHDPGVSLASAGEIPAALSELVRPAPRNARRRS